MVPGDGEEYSCLSEDDPCDGESPLSPEESSSSSPSPSTRRDLGHLRGMASPVLLLESSVRNLIFIPPGPCTISEV